MRFKMLIYEISVILIKCSSALIGTWTLDLSLTKGVLYRRATRAILKWAGLDRWWLPAAQWFWSVQNKFRRPFCGCQIIFRECCNLSLVHLNHDFYTCIFWCWYQLEFKLYWRNFKLINDRKLRGEMETDSGSDWWSDPSRIYRNGKEECRIHS